MGRVAGRVAGKVAVVSGGGRGMGAAHARALIAEGAKVVIGDVDDDDGAKLIEQLGEQFGDQFGDVADFARFTHLDVTEPDEWQAAVALAVETFGTLDVLVNNAGIANINALAQFELAAWRRIIDVNLTGTFLGMQAAVEPMIAAGGGSIINISSVEGMRGSPGLYGYVASKFGVRGLAKAAAVELAPHNIRVNTVLPGLVRTRMAMAIPDDSLQIPLGRAAKSPEVAACVLYLASDESSYSTGADFVVDGGLTAGIPHNNP